MSFALSAGVTGLQAHQKMLDVAGNNLANVNTTAYKSSRVIFSELLSETVKKASQPTGQVGGTNPQQMGSGVGVAGISPDMTQGNIDDTGNPLDMAIDGEGYFVVSDGQQNMYTRAGAFAVDANSNLVDPSTGYLVQRIGSTGENDGFQESGNNNIKVPYDTSMPAKATSTIDVSGNLSADATSQVAENQVITSDMAYTVNDGDVAETGTAIANLDQFSGSLTSGQITISGLDHNGDALTGDLNFAVDGTTTMGDFIDHLNNNVLDNATASLINGQIRVTDDSSGYSKLDMKLEYSDTNGDSTSLEMPGYFEYSSVGGEEVKNVNITVYDSQGGKHVLSGAFVKTNQENKWDMVLSSITGDVDGLSFENRRIENITFNSKNGSFEGISGEDNPQFQVTFGYDNTPQEINVNMGTPGQFDGLTQFAGDSTAVAREQNGYEAGRLSTVSVNNEGILIGSFSNGIKKNIAKMQIALFQNSSGLESVGDGYYIPSANSGEAIATQAMSGGAGTIHGSALEKSNADVASEFVNLIEAQNGFQANSRTIQVANKVLSELTNLIR